MTNPHDMKGLSERAGAYCAIKDGHNRYQTDDPRNQGIFELGDWLIIPPTGPGPVAIVAGEENAKKIAGLLSGSLVPVERVETPAARDVLAERNRQIEVEAWTPEHDDQHSGGALGDAAAAYALSDRANDVINTLYKQVVPQGRSDPSRPYFWPFDDEWWKPKSRRENLVRAGALILAEIERFDRETLKGDT